MNFRPKAGENEEARIDIAPLIDVVFLLLLFFLLTTTFASQRLLEVVLPESGSETPSSGQEELVVVIGADGRFGFDGREIEEGELRAALRAAGEADPDRVLLILADREVAHGRVVTVMDLARRSGLLRVSIATEGRGSSSDTKDPG